MDLNRREGLAGSPAWTLHLPDGVDPSEVDLLRAGSLTRAWEHHWTDDPAQPVLHDAAHGWITASELNAYSRNAAQRLYDLGLRAGDRILLSASASASLIVNYIAALRLGLVVVPANTGYKAQELTHIVRDAGVSAAIVDDQERAEWIRSASSDQGLAILQPALSPTSGTTPLPLDESAPDTPAMICYTSGTTGAPKGAILSHGNLLASAEAVRLAWRWSRSDRLVLTLPLFHLHGLGVGVNGSLLAGASIVIHQRFEVDAVLDAITEHDATLFFGVPTMYARLADSPRVAELGALRLCVSGSAPLPAALHARLQEAAGIRVIERYGMTETVMNVSHPYDGDRRPGSVGIPLPGVDVQLSEPNEGEILVRGPNVFSGYWQRPEATATSFTDAGWFRTGDIGRWDDDGYLRIVGRSKELIISGGFNVHPREVEDVLRRLPSIEDVAIVGTPSDEWGETVTAYVVACGAQDPDGLVEHARRSLASYKVPRMIHYVSELPRNALGKVVKSELRP